VSSQAPPLVSIGIPTWNRANSLERAVLSALGQDYRPLEVVVSDNASTDPTADLCRRLAASHPEVVYLAHPVNRGATANFVAALTAAHGEYFMWLGDDDWLGDGYIRECMRVHRSDPGFALVSGLPMHHGPEGSLGPTPRTVDVTDDYAPDRVVSYYRQVSDNGVIYGIARRANLLQIPFRHVFGMDWHLVAALAVRGKILTLTSVELHRERRILPKSEGVSARSIGYPRWHSWFPTLTIALSALRMIWFDDAYRRLPARTSTGIRVAWICLGKRRVFGKPPLGKSVRDAFTAAVAVAQRRLPVPVYSFLRSLYRRLRPPRR
jgi:glycosyltransferase involved in cell wall biosynthesis